MQSILADVAVSVSELKKNPSGVLAGAGVRLVRARSLFRRAWISYELEFLHSALKE